MRLHVLAGEPQAVVVFPSPDLSPLLSIALFALVILLTATIAGRARDCAMGRSLSWAVVITSLATLVSVMIGLFARPENSLWLFNDGAALMFLILVAITVSACAIISSLGRGAASTGLLILGLVTMAVGTFSAVVGYPGSSTTQQPINSVRVSVNEHATSQAIANRDKRRVYGATSLSIGAVLFITGAVAAGVAGRKRRPGDTRSS